jgi:uncharacterized protein YjiS (DUF1127 family)
MPFEIQSPDTGSAVASVVAGRQAAGYWYPADSFAATVFRWLPEPDNLGAPGPEDPPPGAGPEQPPDDDQVWRWIRKAASWLLTLAIEGLAAYANAMHPVPDLYEPPKARATAPPCERPSHGGHVDRTRAMPKDVAAARPEPSAGAQVALAIAPARQTRIPARLGRLRTRWRRQVDARRHAALLETFSDRMLRDIGVGRDQTDPFVEGGYRHNGDQID